MAITRERRDECTIFVEKLQIRRPLGRPRRRREYIRMELQEIGMGGGA